MSPRIRPSSVWAATAVGDSKTVKAGLMFGKDWQGKGAGLQYEGKTWIALSIGAGL
jgi:hypothetical protein